MENQKLTTAQYQTTIDNLLDEVSKLKRDFEAEKNIKNNLYFFILQQGLLDELKGFSNERNMTSEKGHSDCIEHLLNNSQST